MLCFPSFQGVEAPKRLSPDQFGGQELPQKSQLRARFKEERNKLRDLCLATGGAWGAAHMEVLAAFLESELNWSGTEARHWPVPWAAYFPIGSELNLLGHVSMNTCWLPLVEPKKKLSWFRWLKEIDTWKTDALGLPIPPPSTERCELGHATDSPRLIITPCLAVDTSGTRLGYGGGYYDRLLHEFHESIFTVACVPERLCFKDRELPRAEHDMPVDLIITETNFTLLSPDKLKSVLKR